MSEYKTNGCDGISCKGCGRQDKQLNVFDWLADVPGNIDETDFVEVQFKNTRKGYYLNSNKIPLEKDDIVAVEASPGHDIGTVTLTGSLVLLQMRKARIKSDAEVRRVYRKAREVDMEKYNEAKAKEQDTMIRSRQIAKDLGLEMKIGDVEYQGDGNKAIFYYIADGRVDFRQLIKVLADVFKVRIEMKQIGARQEAGRIGGIGPCGRELCCATWLTNFTSVSTSAARFQDLSMNPQKLAGQCAKLKCCMNFELPIYRDALKDFPPKDIVLQSKEADYFHFKTDVFKRKITYSTSKHLAANLVVLSVERANEIIEINKRGEKVDVMEVEEKNVAKEEQFIPDYQNVVGQDSLTRFDKTKRKKKKNRNRNKNNKQNEKTTN
jgi:cell fate regulator YaaT (PSP1 superfamily)